MTFGSGVSLVFLFFLFKRMYIDFSKKRLIRKIGKTTEKLVNKDLAQYAMHTKNKFSKGAIFNYGDNKVFEVDSILVTTEAIFVVEIKSVKGNVVGDANEANLWKEKGVNRYSITNPIKQNDKHIMHIKNILGVRVPIVSLIVFGDTTDFIKVDNVPQHVLMCKKNALFDTLDQASSVLSSVMTKNQANAIFKKIKQNQTSSLKHKLLHWRITRGK